MSNLPLPLGTVIPPWGEISAVSYRDGERYYMLTADEGRDVALMPASLVEPVWLMQQKQDQPSEGSK